MRNVQHGNWLLLPQNGIECLPRDAHELGDLCDRTIERRQHGFPQQFAGMHCGLLRIALGAELSHAALLVVLLEIDP
jgi:hypothetical protein